jgi:phospholipase C
LFFAGLFFISCGSEKAPSPAKDISRIQHIVFLIKENRTFDSYFGTFPGADGATTGITSNGDSIPLRPTADSTPAGNLCNSWDCSILAMNGGKMNDFDLSAGGSLDAYTQATEATIPNYWAYARHFALADHYITSIHGPSLPNYLCMVAAQSGGVIDNGTAQPGAACNGQQIGAVTVLDAQEHTRVQAPCFDFPSLPDRLEEARIRWRYYVTGGGSMNMLRNSEYWADDFVPNEQIITDAQTGNLPAMSWIFSDGADVSEHPPDSICRGENWTVQVLNAIMQGPDWNSTVVFVTWDDFVRFVRPRCPASGRSVWFGPTCAITDHLPFREAGKYLTHHV